jgi:hypothetical protein
VAKHDVDPVLRQLVRAVNESGQVAVPVAVSVNGATLTGALIAQKRYFNSDRGSHCPEQVLQL